MHPDTAITLNNLAILAFYQGRYEQAESLFHRALIIREQVLGTEHPETANTLDSWGILSTKLSPLKRKFLVPNILIPQRRSIIWPYCIMNKRNIRKRRYSTNVYRQ